MALPMLASLYAPGAHAGIACDPSGDINSLCALSIIQERGFPGGAASTMIELQNGGDVEPATCEVFSLLLNRGAEAGEQQGGARPQGGDGGPIAGLCFDIGTRAELLAGGSPRSPYGSYAPYVAVTYVPVVLRKSTRLISYTKLMRTIERAQDVVENNDFKPLRILNEPLLTVAGPISHLGGGMSEAVPNNGSATSLSVRARIKNQDTGDIDNAFFPPSFPIGPGIYRFVFDAPYLAPGNYRILKILVETEAGDRRTLKSARMEFEVESHGMPME
ncbi:MAG: hypothetical protein AAF515_00220 [Pseudomonadota bacterium]